MISCIPKEQHFIISNNGVLPNKVIKND